MQISVYQHQESTRPLLVNNKGTMSLWELDAFGWMASRGIGFLTCARQKKLSISADKHARLTYRALCVPPQKRSDCITQTAIYCTAMDSHERAYPPNKLKDQWMYTYRIYGGFQVEYHSRQQSTASMGLPRCVIGAVKIHESSNWSFPGKTSHSEQQAKN